MNETRKSLCRTVAKKTKSTNKKCRAVLEALLDEIIRRCANGEEAYLYGIGTFKSVDVRRAPYDFQNSEVKPIESQRKIRLFPDWEFKRRLRNDQ
jgi:nucleoid DNA-binding protein